MKASAKSGRKVRNIICAIGLAAALTAACSRGPGVTIFSPDNGSVFEEGEGIFFKASISEPGGVITQVRWTSSLDGDIWSRIFDDNGTTTQVSFNKHDLSPGVHDIYCYAYQGQFLLGGGRVRITVGADNQTARFSLVVASPLEGWNFTRGEEVTLSAAARDPLDGFLEGSAVAWASDRDGPIGTGPALVTRALSEGVHAIRVTATNSQGEQASAEVNIRVFEGSPPPSSTTTSTAGAETTSSLSGSESTTSAAGGGSSSTTSAGGSGSGSTTTAAGAEAGTTTSLAGEVDCGPDEIGCMDPDYSTEQYWCCEDYSTCGKAEPVDGHYQGTCIYPTTTISGITTTASTTTTIAVSRMYLSADSESDLLFHIVHADGTAVYYYGFDTDGGMRLTHAAFEDGSAVIFSDGYLAVQWIADNLSVAVYNSDPPFDSRNAFHVAVQGAEESTFTIDIYPSDLNGIIAAMEAENGKQYSEVSALLSANSISSFGDLVALADQPGDGQARFVAAAAGFGAAAAFLGMDASGFGSESRVQANITDIHSARSLLKDLAFQLLEAWIIDEFGPQPPQGPDEPSVEVLLCRGATSWANICHYLLFKKPGMEVGPCIPFCKTSMSCYSTICVLQVLSAQSAADFQGLFYD